ncbi:MAG: hypothetical protein ACXWBS_04295 [Chthoniobacterales bacterium]
MKRKSHIITAACVAALVVCAPSLAFAASKKSASPAPAASASPVAKAAASPAASKAPRAIPFRGTASAVDQSGKTFTIAGKEHSRVFKVTDQTKITKDDKGASFSDLTDDTKVTGSYWKKDDGTLELKSLKIGGKMEAAASATPAAKKSKKSDASTAASPAASPKK